MFVFERKRTTITNMAAYTFDIMKQKQREQKVKLEALRTACLSGRNFRFVNLSDYPNFPSTKYPFHFMQTTCFVAEGRSSQFTSLMYGRDTDEDCEGAQSLNLDRFRVHRLVYGQICKPLQDEW